jgi:adenosine deaminase/aminodeoxyfutalosine deaminase
MMQEIEAFIHRLPKAELHLHLEGTILPSTLVELSARHDARPLTLPEAEALYRFTDFTGFLEAFKAVTRLLIGPDDYELATWRMMEHLAEQGVVHAEVFISVGVIYLWRNHDPASAGNASWASRSIGFLTPCATSPSPRPSASFSRPPN